MSKQKHSASSTRWLKEHFDDKYVNEAKKKGYRSRAIFKIEEIQNKDKLLKAGMTVVDLGAAPGGWSQFAAKVVGEGGRVIACDLLPMESIAGVSFLQGDFREEAVLNALLDRIQPDMVDVVMSDMAPKIWRVTCPSISLAPCILSNWHWICVDKFWLPMVVLW